MTARRPLPKVVGMQLQFLGATGTVTGSRYLLQAAARNVLVDCGLFQGYKQLRLRNWAAPPFDPPSLRAVVLTHAHIDHSGYLLRPPIPIERLVDLHLTNVSDEPVDHFVGPLASEFRVSPFVELETPHRHAGHAVSGESFASVDGGAHVGCRKRSTITCCEMRKVGHAATK